MKTINILQFLTIAIMITSCSQNTAKKELEGDVDSDYMISTSDEYYDIIYNEEGYTLDDLDTYYRKIKETRKNEKNYNNLRKITINTMYLSKDLLKVEDKSLLAYYVDELISMPYISDMNMFQNMLENLIDYWENDKISEVASMIVLRNAKYIHENFPNPSEIQNLPHQLNGTQDMFNLISLD